MTLAQLLNSDADTLEKLTTEELNTFFEPYLRVTRPELVAEERAKNPQQGSVRHSSRANASRKKEEELELFNKFKMVERLAAERGIKLKLT